MKCYFTFGQIHVHSVVGKTVDKDCVASIEGEDWEDCRAKAFATFGDKFHRQYTEEELTNHILSYYPRGIIDLQPLQKGGDAK